MSKKTLKTSVQPNKTEDSLGNVFQNLDYNNKKATKKFPDISAIKEFITSSNFIKRGVLGTLMCLVFYWLCHGNINKLVIFTILITTGIYYELICLVKLPNSSFAFNSYLVIYMSILIYSSQIIPKLNIMYPWIKANICKYRVFSFYGYSLGFVKFIHGLRKGNLRKQILLFTILHLSGILMGMTCNIAISNLQKGKYYFIYPATLVITNDVSAYFIGKLFGKTPLYSLSPKKTVEGFIGGFLFTILIGIIGSLKVSSNIKSDNFVTNNFMFILAASLLAPFMGFFASAIKRLFKKKDFGSIIPGHGGVTDRMDCQILMAWFTFYYLQGMGGTKNKQISNISSYILKNFTSEEISIIISKIYQASTLNVESNNQ